MLLIPVPVKRDLKREHYRPPHKIGPWDCLHSHVEHKHHRSSCRHACSHIQHAADKRHLQVSDSPEISLIPGRMYMNAIRCRYTAPIRTTSGSCVNSFIIGSARR